MVILRFTSTVATKAWFSMTSEANPLLSTKVLHMEIHNLTTLLTMATPKPKCHSNSLHDHYSCLPTGILKHRGFDQEIHINPNSNPHHVLFRKHHSRQLLHVLLLLPVMGRDLQRNSAQRGKGCSPQRRSSMIQIAANSLAQSI